MPIWKLESVDQDSPQWETSYYNGPLVVRAHDESRAREIASQALQQMTRQRPRGDTLHPVWMNTKEVTCTLLENSDFDEEGPDAILDPPEYDQMFREMESIGQAPEPYPPLPEVIVDAEGPVVGRYAVGKSQSILPAIKQHASGPISTESKAESVLPSIRQHGAGPGTTNTTVTPESGQIEILGERPTLHIQPGPELTADPDDRIRLSDPDAVPVATVKEQHAASLGKLLELRDKLDEFHGEDAPDVSGSRNTQQLPLSEEEIQLLRAIVESSIALHSAPSLPKRATEALRNLYECLVDMKGHLDRLSETFDSLKSLAFKVGEAVLAIKELLDILGVTS